MQCTFAPSTDPNESGQRRWKCSREKCGIETGYTPHEADRIFSRCRVWGLGDYVAFVLGVLGITPQRIEWATGKPCKCGERADTLNTWGERLRAWWLSA